MNILDRYKFMHPERKFRKFTTGLNVFDVAKKTVKKARHMVATEKANKLIVELQPCPLMKTMAITAYYVQAQMYWAAKIASTLGQSLTG